MKTKDEVLQLVKQDLAEIEFSNTGMPDFLKYRVHAYLDLLDLQEIPVVVMDTIYRLKLAYMLD